MRQMRLAWSSTRGLGLTVGLAVALFAAAPAWAQEAQHPEPAPVAVADDDLTAALETGELTEAEYTLERARSIFQLGKVRREFGDVVRPSARDTTLILRDLAARVDELAGAERKAAKRILARPDDPSGAPLGSGWDVDEADLSPQCGAHVCVHWVDAFGNDDAPPPDDVNPANGIPDWVDLTLFTWEEIWFQEIDTLGYRAPQSDLDSPNPGRSAPALLDVYLDDLGSIDVFGFCTTDDPQALAVFAVSAYCVIDDDYSPTQFGTEHTSREFMEVTSAHEFHHAAQFAYDYLEDYWFMEGTATNIEETVFPAIDDNVNFLDAWSPLSRPSYPLDRGGFSDSEYGSWIFWRFLEEKVGLDPSILLEIWERADAFDPSPSPADDPPDDYSLEAVRYVLAERGLGIADVFADFGTANRLLDYADAAAAGYPSPPRTRMYKVGARSGGLGWSSVRINHLATRYYSFQPGLRLSAAARLKVKLGLPTWSRATLIVVNADGSTAIKRLERGVDGRAQAKVPFGRGVVKRVEVVLSNGDASIRSCWQYPGPPSYSCEGRPKGDGKLFEFRARIL
jgi:hypothetical protein